MPPHLVCNVHLPSSWDAGGPHSKPMAPVVVVTEKPTKKKRSITAADIPTPSFTSFAHSLQPPPSASGSRATKRQALGAAASSVAAAPAGAPDIGGGPPQSAKDACESILASIQRSSALAERHLQEEREHSINLDHILSRVPYKEMLRDLFGSGSYAAPKMPVVTKAYEEMFMREPMFEYERPCVMGSQCECNFVSSIPGDCFTGVEFLLPGDEAQKQQQLHAQMCVLCHRRLVQKLFYDIIYAGSPYR